MNQHEIDLLVEKTLHIAKVNKEQNHYQQIEVENNTQELFIKPIRKPIQNYKLFLRPKIYRFSMRIAQFFSD